MNQTFADTIGNITVTGGLVRIDFVSLAARQPEDPQAPRQFEITQRVTEQARELGYTSVNYDLIYGLPRQTHGAAGNPLPWEKPAGSALQAFPWDQGDFG